MAVETVNGIVVGCTDYRDNDRMLTLFTAERGRVDCKARNCRKATAPLLACAQPFVYGEYAVFLSGERGTVNAAEVKESFYALREDPDRFLAASMAARLTLSVIEPDAPNEPLFSLLYHTLSFLAYSPAEPMDLLAGFLIRFCDRIGYRPVLTQCAVCRRDVRRDAVLFFSAEAGGTVCVACPHGGKPVNRTALEAMRRMLLLSDAELNQIRMSEPLRRAVLESEHAVLEHALGPTDRGVQLLEQILG
ncbi:MAG: DNA repair protein RecO [Clostridia bacterium]|nr:DNA repair protein RecO [Clostridia bacterium]